ncbi:MAG TPA: HNH endonuclease [Rhizomicrobium sp.]|nr:HNH endonuclease [Rhizomicrobium sp.]
MAERLRGRVGQAQRARRLKRTDGLCEHCLKLGRTTLATVVNHIVPLVQGGSDEDSNTENVCREHDLIETAKQFGHNVTADGRGIGRSGRPTSPDHPWNRAPRRS